MKNNYIILSIAIFFFLSIQMVHAQSFGRYHYHELDYLAYQVKSVEWVSGAFNQRDFYFQYEYKPGIIIEKHTLSQDSLEKHYFYTDSTRLDSIIAYITYDTNWGIAPRSMHRYLSSKTFFHYNPQGQLICEHSCSRHNSIIVDSFFYNSNGLMEVSKCYKNIQRSILRDTQIDTLQVQEIKQYRYNQQSKLISSHYYDMPKMSYVYDADGRLSQSTQFLGIGKGNCGIIGNDKNFSHTNYRYTPEGLLAELTFMYYSITTSGQLINKRISKQRCKYTFYKK